ncbi:hypothetical protein B0H14DRAFT_3432083 [Mycena olivaceomarginata]|nr:hypothetical protein B0H14DRAFT_3432083 [Mycena olivaceomarginata]
MAALRAKQKSDPPTVQAARLAAKEGFRQKVSGKNRNILALKAIIARDRARRGAPAGRGRGHLTCDAGQRNRLDSRALGRGANESDEE